MQNNNEHCKVYSWLGIAGRYIWDFISLSCFGVLEGKLLFKEGNLKVALLSPAKDREINMQPGFSDKWILLGH